jgi:hypothetical protein
MEESVRLANMDESNETVAAGTQAESTSPATSDNSQNAESTEVFEKSAFDPANFNEVTLIMLMRLYDLQLALLSVLNPEQAKYIVELHERGQSFAPPPAFVEYAEEDRP